jgi:hypothetical protein
MGRGDYRGGGNLLGWNANRYVAPSLTGRTRKGKALIKDLTARTAQSREELAAQDERARKRHGLGTGKAPARTQATAASTGATGVAEAARKRLKAGGGRAFTVTVVRKKRRKGPNG